MEIDQYKETATLDENGRVLSLECDGVSMPAGYGFAGVNDWVHDTGRHFEELQWHALGAANAYDQLQAKYEALEREYSKDRLRLDWLAAPANGCGAVQLWLRTGEVPDVSYTIDKNQSVSEIAKHYEYT